MMLSVAVTAIFLTLMPDTVPMHYNIKGEIDRYGSKYENLIMPVSMILLGVLFLLLARHFRKRQQLENQGCFGLRLSPLRLSERTFCIFLAEFGLLCPKLD